MPVLIAGAVAADVAIANALQPPTRGVASPGGVTIPGDWLAQCIAGTRVPGCTTHSIEGTTMLVTPTVQVRIKDAALVASLGLNPAQVTAFRGRIDAGTLVVPATGGERLPNPWPRKAGVTAIPRFDGAGVPQNPATAAQQQALLEDSGCSWWYNFNPTPEGVTPLANGGKFVPMLVDPSDVTPTKIAQAVANAEGGRIMFLGEADGRLHTVQQCVDAWLALTTDAAILANPQIILGSLYTSADGSLANSFFRQWMTGIAGMRQPGALVADGYNIIQSIVVNRMVNLGNAFPSIPEWWLAEFATDSGLNGGGATQDAEKTWMVQISETLDRLPKLVMYMKWYLCPPDYSNQHFGLRALYDNASAPTSTVATWQGVGRSLAI